MILSMFAGILLSGADAAGDWPAWRGPAGTGEAAATANPPTEWSAEKNIAWKVAVPGNGSSTPIVLGNRVFLLTAISAAGKTPAPAPKGGDGPSAGKKEFGKGGRGKGGFGGGPPPKDKHQFVALAIDRQTGKTLWQTTLRDEVPHEGHHRDHGFASMSPVTDGERLYVYYGSRGLHALSLDGEKLWSKDLGKMKTRAGFGEGASPAVHHGVLVAVWDHEGDDFIAAFDAKTGEEKWRTPRDEATSWTTPLIATAGGKTVAIVPGANACRAYDLATGKEVWRAPGLTSNVIPTGIVQGDTVFLTSGFRGAALMAIKLGKEGDLAGTDAILWRHDKGTPYVPSPALAGNRLYFFANSTNVATCLDTKTGKPLFESQRVPGLGGVYASPAAAGGHVYMVDRSGTTVVLAAGDELKVIATNALGEGVDASPAIAGNELFLRGREHLFKIAAK